MAPSASPTYPLTLGSLGEVSGHVENQGDSGDNDVKDNNNDDDNVEKDNGSVDNGDDDEVVLWLMKPSLAAARQ